VTKRDAIACCIWIVLVIMMHLGITFGISFAIAYLVVNMGLLNVSVGKMALLIWLVRLLWFNSNENPRKHE
jgi:hypothetical protein